MNPMFISLLLILLLSGCGGRETNDVGLPDSASEVTLLHHKLSVRLLPESGELEVVDTLSAGSDAPVRSFALNAAFNVELNGRPLTPAEVQGAVAVYRLDTELAASSVELRYRGPIESTNDCDWLRQHCRLLNARGVYLDAGSLWYPQQPDAMHRFTLEVELPDGWTSLSQGDALGGKGWQETLPQDDIYLLAGPFKVYRSEQAGRTALVYLQRPDEALAQTYLQATHRYLDQYSQMLGDYPYGKFATVESFWETGWGMPSFTLLGSQVMRLPFIPYTSFPHEILHNWWGNSVYINTNRGNWAEGLTAYLSDHLMQQQRGTDASYRRDALQKFSVFTAHGGDFPLAQFRSRHDNTTQAVGYSKSLMLFHMLRQTLGDETFFKGLRRFYSAHSFRSASFDDLKASFEAVAGQSLTVFFDQWLDRTGAPRLTLEKFKAEQGGLTISLTQQAAQPYSLRVPVRMTLADGSEQTRHWALDQPQQTFQLKGDIKTIAIDPDYDLMRQPHAEEIPPTLNSLDAAHTLYLDSRGASDAQAVVLAQWQQQMEQRGARFAPQAGDGVVTVTINPAHAGKLLDSNSLQLPEGTLSLQQHAAAFARPAGEGFVIAAPDTDALVTLLRKLPHYGKYSYIALDAKSGENVAKGQWPVENSPMVWKREQ